jgi:hypothetical protein
MKRVDDIFSCYREFFDDKLVVSSVQNSQWIATSISVCIQVDNDYSVNNELPFVIRCDSTDLREVLLFREV